ncbi:MAG TPA: DUF1905 domain-containing protein [Jatrophihabitantaceae bacterium]|nr:DUF1905 domain-containing protein [Jatrophihabitantaceae bacterium]
MDLEFSGEILYWRGPAPYYFVSVPDDKCVDLHAISKHVSYGWGVIPVEARIGRTVFETSLFPKDGGYLVPVKDRVRNAEGLDAGETVTVRLKVGARSD